MLRSDSALTGLLVLSAALAAPALGAQERVVVGKEVAVGRSEAALRVEFDDGDDFEVALRDGSVVVDDRTIGAYRAGDELDTAFRSLLGDAVALENGPLAAMLRDWSPPATLSGDRADLARRIDQALERALSPRRGEGRNAAGPSVIISSGDEADLVRVLLGQAGRLQSLQRALENLSEQSLAIHVQEDVRVEAGETVDGTLVVVQGDAVVAGRVTGDVIVVDGRLEVLDGGEVGGGIRLVDARLVREEGRVRGTVVNVGEDDDADVRVNVREDEIRDRIREEIRAELRNEIRREIRHDDDRGAASALTRPFRATARAVGGVLQNLLVVLLLGAIGVAFTAFAGENLDVVAHTARRAPGRAAVVGLAGSFLLVPVWVLGTVALAISIVGIPVVLAWVPLFPVAALAAAVLGFLAVARNVGEWLADSDYRYTHWIRRANPVYTIFGGLLGLMSLFMVANALHIVPFVGALRWLLTVTGIILLVLASQIGFGAVLLTRAGRRPEYDPMDPEEAWRRAVNVDLDIDDVDPAAGPERPARDPKTPNDHA